MVRRQVICPTACPFLGSFQACATNITCSCGVLNGASSEFSACLACIQSIDQVLAQQFAAAAQDCALLFPTSHIVLPTSTSSSSSPIASAVVCTSECAPIIQASTCTADACACPAYLTAGAACLQCTGTANATASSILSSSISICFSQLLSVSGTVLGSQTPVPTSVPQSTTPPTTAAIPTGIPCASQCSDIISAPQTCTGDLCSCSAYVKEGPACYSCTQPFNATAASILTKDISICLSNFPALGTAAPTPPPCFTPCAFTQQISAVCGVTNDTCFCPTYVASASACSACYATVNITYARILSIALDICSSEFPELFNHSTTSSPSSSSGRSTSFVTNTLTTILSGSGAEDGLHGLARLYDIQWGILVAILMGLLMIVL